MLYKTITLGLLEALPTLYHRLRRSRTLLRELDRYARDLRATHLRRMGEGADSSAAMELAVAEIQQRIAAEAERPAA